MKKNISVMIIAGIFFIIGIFSGWYLCSERYSDQLENTVAMSWGDGLYGKAFYGAYVYLHKGKTGYDVYAKVYIGRGNDYFHDCGILGVVQTPEEAVEKWSQITWKPEGLFIGENSGKPFFLKREELEAHR